ncbi:protamine-like protein 99C [Drosophila miranda]|uniref:protamine-like protein 99C n=1 Tax=Drosophila miranda TaxID=7229 RepID=UPI0007E731A4|nr:protamine-like protein 99C [Drosophila miranda]
MGCSSQPQKKYRAQKVGPVTKNGYLNYLRVFKKKHCGLSPREMISKGAKAWNALTCEQKANFRKKTKSGRKSHGKKSGSKPKRC